MVLGVDPSQITSMLGAGQSTQQAPIQTNAQEAGIKDFLAVVLGDTEQVWGQLFQQAGFRYQAPALVLYRDATPTACGTGQAAAGPFYCPGDNKLYLDLSFLSELKRMGASGDFALAYVIAHEVGHHIQTLEGTAEKVQAARARSSKVAGNRIQVAMELQADCYAGVWAHHAQKQRQILEQGDLEEGMTAAASVGDDHLQRMAGRRVVPEGFTHGSSEQRQQWLLRGLKSGDVSQCDTFS
jgi:predicted metalloprotease